MKKLSEVSKLTGITRRALQGYEAMGLLPPTSKTKAGYWLYDDEAIQKLLIIKVFTEGGYSREEVKTFFESSSSDTLQECNNLINSLNAKKREIEGMIRTVRFFKIERRLSNQAQNVLATVDPARTYRDQSFSNYLEVLPNRMSMLPGEVDAIDLEMYLLFWYSLVVVGLLSKSGEKKPIKDAIDESYEIFVVLMFTMDGFDGSMDKMTEDEKEILFQEFVMDYLKDEGIKQAMNDACGGDTSTIIMNIVSEWRD